MITMKQMRVTMKIMISAKATKKILMMLMLMKIMMIMMTLVIKMNKRAKVKVVKLMHHKLIADCSKIISLISLTSTLLQQIITQLHFNICK